MPNVVFHRSTFIALIAVATLAHATPPVADKPTASAPEGRVDALRRTFVELRRDIALTDGAPLEPGPGQVAVYATIDLHAKATLDRLVVEADGATAADARYAPADVAALRRGAAHPVWVGAADTLAVHVFGTADGKPFDRIFAIDAAPHDAPRFIELTLAQTETKGVPDVVVWSAGPNDSAQPRAAACDWLLGCAVAAEATVRADLQYRSILYDLYRDRADDALVRAVALRSLGRDPTTLSQLSLAELAAAVATGTHAITDAIVASDDVASLEPQLRLRKALLAARAYRARREWQPLHAALGRFDAAEHTLGALALPAPVAAELGFLRAEDAIANGDFDRAQAVIAAQLSPQDPQRPYALFNLAVALRSAGIPNRAEQVFAQVATMPVYTDDALDVRARARVALAALELQRTQSASSEAALRDAPANGRYREQFLAAYGARTMQHGDYPLAARIWLTLAREAPWSAAGKTALVAYPMCLEHIAAPAVALAQYRDAEARFEQRLVDLDALLARTRDIAWDRGLVDAFARPPDASLRDDPALVEWRDRIGNDDWLMWLNADSTRAQLQELADLERISAALAAGVPSTFDARARALASAVVRAADDRRAPLARTVAAIAANEVAMAQQQLRLIRVGIARTSDGAAQRPAVGATP
jgi:hypothetical protein